MIHQELDIFYKALGFSEKTMFAKKHFFPIIGVK